MDRAASFYIHSEAVGQAIDAKVDVYCKFSDFFFGAGL